MVALRNQRERPVSAPSLRVLVIEDDTIIGLLLAEMLEALGHCACAIATTQTEAVAAALDHRPDLMLVDVGLGGGSGVAAVRKILRNGHIPHVFMSGAYVRADSADAGVLHKPFGEADLVDAMRRAIATGPVRVPAT
jgi:CheY-like chemotaxis protein